MTKKGILVTVRIGEVPAAIEGAWNHWYHSKHIPSRLKVPGFLSARRFAVVESENVLQIGGYKYLTLYDLSGVDVLTSEAYLKLRESEASLPPTSFEFITQNLPNLSRGIYEQIYPEQGEYHIPHTNILFTVGHDVPSNREEEFNAWYNTEHIPAMNRVPGFVTARRFKVIETPMPPASGKTVNSPKYLTLYDLESEKVFQSEAFLRETNSPWSSWVRSWYSRRIRLIAQRIYPRA